MPYTAFTLLALIIHIIVSFDILFRSNRAYEKFIAVKQYQIFLISIAVFYLTDILWGAFEENKLALALYIDTVIYFLMMGTTIFFWTRFVVRFLQGNKVMGRIIELVGLFFFAAEIVLLIINIPLPILFRVDLKTCVYESYLARNIMLYVQIGMYIVLSGYTVVTMLKAKGAVKRRNIAVLICSLVTAVMITIQVFNAYLPLYSMGMLLGVCILNNYVVNDIKEEYRVELAASKVKEKIQEEKLSNAVLMAHTDPLTGVKNKHAYVEMEEQIDRSIGENKMEDFAIVVCDLNGLKKINDTYGHDAGDKYIVDSAETIKKFFGDEELYRFGGDEFVVILKGEQYKKRRALVTSFNQFIDECLDTKLPIISAGMSIYKKGEDNTLRAIFNRADKMMYARKETLKDHSL